MTDVGPPPESRSPGVPKVDTKPAAADTLPAREGEVESGLRGEILRLPSGSVIVLATEYPFDLSDATGKQKRPTRLTGVANFALGTLGHDSNRRVEAKYPDGTKVRDDFVPEGEVPAKGEPTTDQPEKYITAIVVPPGKDRLTQVIDTGKGEGKSAAKARLRQAIDEIEKSGILETIPTGTKIYAVGIREGWVIEHTDDGDTYVTDRTFTAITDVRDYLERKARGKKPVIGAAASKDVPRSPAVLAQIKAANQGRTGTDFSNLLPAYDPLYGLTEGEQTGIEELVPKALEMALLDLRTRERWEQEGFHPDIFVSYSRDDIGFTEALVQRLRKSGFDQIFRDLDVYEGIEAGADWRKIIPERLNASTDVVFVMTPSSINSKACQDELRLAKESGKRISVVTAQSVFEQLRKLPTPDWVPQEAGQWIIFPDPPTDTANLDQYAAVDTARFDGLRLRLREEPEPVVTPEGGGFLSGLRRLVQRPQR